METQVLTSNGTVKSGNVTAEYIATHDLSENKHSFVSYIKKDGKQVGYMNYSEGKRLTLSLSDPDALTGEEQKSIVAILIEKLQEKKQMTVQVSDAE